MDSLRLINATFFLLQLVDDKQQIPRVACDPRDVGAYHRVALPGKGKHGRELGAVFVFAGSLIDEKFCRPCAVWRLPVGALRSARPLSTARKK